MFDILHSQFLRSILILIDLILALHIADHIDSAIQRQKLPHFLTQTTSEAGEPLDIPHSLLLYRQRRTEKSLPEDVRNRLQSLLSEQFTIFGEHSLIVQLPNDKQLVANIIAGQGTETPYNNYPAIDEKDVEQDARMTTEEQSDSPQESDNRLLILYKKEERILALRDRLAIYFRPLLVVGLLLALLIVWNIATAS